MPITKLSLLKKDNQGKKALIASTTGYKTGNGNDYRNKSGLASSLTANMPITKCAQMAGSGASVIWTQPMFFSPLHTPQNWQIASRRREVYQWSFISPCDITLYDGSLKPINMIYEEVFANIEAKSDYSTSSCIKSIDSEDAPIIQDGYGNISLPDRASKHKVKKKANKIKALGVAEPLVLTNDHDCIVIKREDIQCHKSKWNKKKCVVDHIAPTCERFKCKECIDKEYKISKIKARDIEKGDHILVPFNTDIIPSVIDNEDKARYAGHLASDGCVSEERRSVRICMGDDEKPFVFPTISKVHKSMGGNDNLVNVSTIQEVRSSKKNILDFAFQLVKGKGAEKKFTDQVTLLDPKLQLDVIGAYIQSDGTYNKQNSCVEITTYSRHLGNQLMLMCFRCGILARLNKQPISRSKKTFKTKNTHRYILNISSSDLPKIAEYVPGKLSDINIKKRNDNRRFFWKNFVVSPVTSNESFDYEGDVYDIRVPGSYTVTANGIAVHQCRFYYDNECKVAAAVDFYATFPVNGFTLECKNKKVLKYYERQTRRLRINHWSKLISHENFLIGDVFPWVEVECKICGGSGTLPNGTSCNHSGGSISRIVILNPDWIEVQMNPLVSEPVIALVPDEELRMIVQRKRPKQIYDNLPKRLIELVSTGAPIPLSNRSVSHIKHNPSPYGAYGNPLLRRAFTVLAYKTKLMTANWIVAERLILPVRVVKIGDKDRPAGPQDISDVSNQLSAVANDPNLTLVTHHAFDYEWHGSTGKIHNINNEIEQIGKELLDGFMLNQALLNGEAGSYSSAQVGVEVMIRRLESWRAGLAEWIEQHIFLPIAMMQGFIDEEESKEIGETVYLYPTVKWNDLQLRDTSSQKQMLVQLHDKGLISSQTLLEEFDMDYDQEIERIREEAINVGPGGQMGGGMPGGDMGGGMPGGMDMGGGMPGGMDMGGGMPGGMPGGDMGGGVPGGMPGGMGGAAAPMGAAAGGMNPPLKVEKRGKGNGPQEQAPPEPQPMLKLTKLEGRMHKMLMNLGLPPEYKMFAQYKVAIAGEQQPYVIDFAIPSIGMGLEADGNIWHDQADSKAHDIQRDQKLSNIGWRILRFNEEAIEERIDAVRDVVIKNIKDSIKQRKSAEDGEMIKVANEISEGDPTKLIYKKVELDNNLGHMYLIGT